MEDHGGLLTSGVGNDTRDTIVGTALVIAQFRGD